MSTRVLTARILIVSGLVLLAGGLILGLLPKTVPGVFGPVSCGSAFHGSDAAAVTDFQDTLGGGALSAPLGSAEAACATKRSDARTVPILLIVLGTGAVIGGVTAGPYSKPRIGQPA